METQIERGLFHKSKIFESKALLQTNVNPKHTMLNREEKIYSVPSPVFRDQGPEIEELSTLQNLKYYKGDLSKEKESFPDVTVKERELASLECEVTAVREQVVDVRANSKGKQVDMVMDRSLLKEKELDYFGAYFKISVIDDESGYTKIEIAPITQSTIWHAMLPSDTEIDAIFNN